MVSIEKRVRKNIFFIFLKMYAKYLKCKSKIIPAHYKNNAGIIGAAINFVK